MLTCYSYAAAILLYIFSSDRSSSTSYPSNLTLEYTLSAYSKDLTDTGKTLTYLGESQKGHFPSNFSQIKA